MSEFIRVPFRSVEDSKAAAAWKSPHEQGYQLTKLQSMCFLQDWPTQLGLWETLLSTTIITSCITLAKGLENLLRFSSFLGLLDFISWALKKLPFRKNVPSRKYWRNSHRPCGEVLLQLTLGCSEWVTLRGLWSFFCYPDFYFQVLRWPFLRFRWNRSPFGYVNKNIVSWQHSETIRRLKCLLLRKVCS